MERFRRSLVLATALTLGAGCTAAASPEYEFMVRAESDPGVPLANVRLSRGSVVLGVSDAKGLVALSLSGAAGETVALDAACPEGFRAPQEPLAITLRTLAEEGRRPEFRVRCAPLSRSVVVAVRAENGPNLPLVYLGREIARTDDKGAAHARLTLAPGETIALSLDTSGPEHAALMPQNPELKLTVPEHDDVVLFDQTFAKEKKKSGHRAKRHAGSRPIQIGPRKI